MDARRRTSPRAASAPRRSRRHRRVRGLGRRAADTIVTHALGSCIAVCIWDPMASVGGLLHFLLPDSAINPERAQDAAGDLRQYRPAAALPGSAYAHRPGQEALPGAAGRRRRRRRSRPERSSNVGKRNVLAARNILWRNGVLIKGEATGGTIPRHRGDASRRRAIDVISSGRDHSATVRRDADD